MWGECDLVPGGPNDRSDSTELAGVLAGTGWNASKKGDPSRTDVRLGCNEKMSFRKNGLILLSQSFRSPVSLNDPGDPISYFDCWPRVKLGACR
jgi:hypothetical protein